MKNEMRSYPCGRALSNLQQIHTYIHTYFSSHNYLGFEIINTISQSIQGFGAVEIWDSIQCIGFYRRFFHRLILVR
ncbi:hypothetical protein QVD17_17085 [Tagetes erecta]|uniref:Uncharacterized protein n=1 Tax=Tagetes erecta TaxID=13708 RepID=A0AAD8KRN1_TARER|nr:hypothetical protein QVD17_17085 [Tagetes erecta]